MKKIHLTFSFLAFALCLLSFTGSEKQNLDLTSKGIPVSVVVPVDAIIESGVGNGLKMNGADYYVWEINKGNFSLEVSMDDSDVYQEIEEYVDFSRELAEDEDFVEYVLEEDNGFIYKSQQYGSTYYSFYFILFKNSRAIEFATGMKSDDESLENILNLYASAKSAK